ncbi:sigma 54-interacting transcriptional regulator [Deminuibacter soli]|uniref:Response regulator n=1 Tax=Deminuibacter soli TaxID=2291815 RepID=A0A3E1NGF8_9BACT|nr:sigma 54-interacting transcriptional regulator [Deminuibacter soli]RFM26967.1 response regulator [Deminuibacter soli]
MNEKILIVEDEFIVANDLRLIVEKAGYTCCGTADSVAAALELISKHKPTLVLLDIFLKGDLTGIDLARRLSEENIAFVYLSANSNQDILEAARATQPYGFLIKPFRQKDVLVTLDIARYRHEHSLEARLRRENALQQVFAQIADAPGDMEEKLLKITTALQPYIPFEYVYMDMFKEGLLLDKGFSFLRTGFDTYESIDAAGLLEITGLSMKQVKEMLKGYAPCSDLTFFNNDDFTRHLHNLPLKKQLAHTLQLKSNLTLPVKLPDQRPFHCCFFSRKPDAYTADCIDMFNRLMPSLIATFNQILKATAAVQKKNAAGKPDNIAAFEGIIGNNHRLLSVLDHLTQVAPLDTVVLILGESGTGKEQIVNAIHQLSPRRNAPLVKINCAALPAALIESELFGHEKGAFTGAYEKRIGKFEQAADGTIFLDEIGEMPVELQVKLLRVLQEKEIERLGGAAPIKVNVRIIAATNRNLEKEVAEGRFRLDLYYRLNVFPVQLPPLRDRLDDVPALVNHFIKVFSKKTGRNITGISEQALQRMMHYHWPGNIRELEHFTERSMLLCKGSIITDVQLPESEGFKPSTSLAGNDRIKTIEENERDHILAVLQKCAGRIWGEGGAAEMLNISPTTLSSKMKRLGIKKEDVK